MGERLSPPGRVGLIGAGAFGRFCFSAYREAPDIEVVAVAESSLDARAAILALGAPTVTSYRELLANPAIEAVHVATPPFLRLDIILAALDAGKSVFVEKPLALSLPDADAMIRRADQVGRPLGVDYVMRHMPAYRLLYTIAASGMAGALRSISLENFAQQVPPEHWFWDRERSGGILVEHGVHFFDAYGRVAGAPLEVRGFRPRPEAIEVTIRYDTGVIGRYYHEFNFPHAVERTTGTAFFERGHVVIEGWIPERVTGKALCNADVLRQVGQMAGVALQIREGEPVEFEATFPARERSYEGAIVAGMRELLRHTRIPGETMTVSASDARDSLAVALVGEESAATGDPVLLAAPLLHS